MGPVRLPRPSSSADNKIGRQGRRPRKYTNWIFSTCGTMPSAASRGIENVSVFSRVSLSRRLAVIGTTSSIFRWLAWAKFTARREKSGASGMTRSRLPK